MPSDFAGGAMRRAPGVEHAPPAPSPFSSHQQQVDPSADSFERRLVFELHMDVRRLLRAGQDTVRTHVRFLEAALPAPSALPTDKLRPLAQHHVDRARSLGEVLGKLLPAWCKLGSDKEDVDGAMSALLSSPDVVGGAVPEGVWQALVTTIDLQIFHMERASALMRNHRQRANEEQQQGQEQGAPPVECRATAGYST